MTTPERGAPASALITDDVVRAVYAEGAGIARIAPRAVAIPRDAGELARIVADAAAARMPLIPRGSGSGMAAGATGDGIVVDVSALDTVDAVRVEARSIRAGAGATCGAVDRAARAQGLRFPVDPSSKAFCTVGGMAAANAAGAHTLAFGATRAWVNSLECVFADGTVAEVRRGAPPPPAEPVQRFMREADAIVAAAGRAPRTRKDSSGYALAEYARSGELVDLLVGSEGTLAFFTAVELRLIPVPGATSSVLGAFRTLEQAVEAASRAAETGAVACELLDRTFLEVAASGGRFLPIPNGMEAVLLAEVEGATLPDANDAAQRVRRLFDDAGAHMVSVALEPQAEATLWELRHAASPILAKLDPSLRSMQFIEDAAVPVERLPDYVRGVRRILERHDTRGVIFGHAGDGHAHVNPLVDTARAGWRDRVAAILAEQTALVAHLGGTLAGEHGDGRLRAPLLGATHDAATIAAWAAVKRAFDPEGLLNPGVIVPLPGAKPLEFGIKYDPDLPPIPDVAARVLRRVEEERAYARSRMELIEEELRRLER